MHRQAIQVTMTVSTISICCSILLLWNTIGIHAFSLSSSSHNKHKFATSSNRLAQQRHHGVFQLSLSSSSASVENEVYPPLSREEIENVLSDIPVYAVSSSKNDDGIVMLNEKDNDNPIAYFFFNPTTANEVFKGLSKSSKQSDDEWRVTQFPLSLIWFELMKFDASTGRAVYDGVEYRLRPDRDQLQSAREVLSAVVKSQGLSEKDDVPDTFLATYNEIPVFLDPRMRLMSEDDNIEQFPMYLSLQDLVTTFQQMTDDDDGMQAMVSVSNLKDLIEQMQSESTVNFRQAKLYAPSTPGMSSSSSSSRNSFNINNNNDDLPLFSGPKEEKPVAPLESTMSGDWDD